MTAPLVQFALYDQIEAAVCDSTHAAQRLGEVITIVWSGKCGDTIKESAVLENAELACSDDRAIAQAGHSPQILGGRMRSSGAQRRTRDRTPASQVMLGHLCRGRLLFGTGKVDTA
jgi:hypothetical protein